MTTQTFIKSTLNFWADLRPGDTLIALVLDPNNGSFDLVAPVGWTLASYRPGNENRAWIFYRVITASEPTSYQWETLPTGNEVIVWYEAARA